MSKAAAMEIATGQAGMPVNPSIITGEIPDGATDPNEVKEPVKSLDSDRFAKLAAKESQLVKMREEYKAERAKFEDELKRFEEVKKKIEEFEALKKTDPVKAFELVGFTQDDFVNWVGETSKEPTPEEIARKAAQEELKKYQEQETKRLEETKKAEEEKSLKEFQKQMKERIVRDAEKFQFSDYYGDDAAETAMLTVSELLKADETLTLNEAIEEALSLTEGYYEERFNDMKSKIKKLNPAPEKKEEPAAVDAPLKAEVSPRRGAPTERNRVLSGREVVKKIPSLSNQATATVAGTAGRRETPAEKRARLETMLRNGGKL